jgi:hypothetical protein
LAELYSGVKFTATQDEKPVFTNTTRQVRVVRGTTESMTKSFLDSIWQVNLLRLQVMVSFRGRLMSVSADYHMTNMQ